MSEHALQVAVAHMLQLVLDPERTWWTAIDHGAGRLSKRAAGMMKARGVKRGLPDFLIMYRDESFPCLIGIELKTDKGRLTPDQLLVAHQWEDMGHAIIVARSLEDVQSILDHMHVPVRSHIVTWGNRHERAQRAAGTRHPRPRHRGKSKNRMSVVLGREA